MEDPPEPSPNSFSARLILSVKELLTYIKRDVKGEYILEIHLVGVTAIKTSSGPTSFPEPPFTIFIPSLENGGRSWKKRAEYSVHKC